MKTPRLTARAICAAMLVAGLMAGCGPDAAPTAAADATSAAPAAKKPPRTITLTADTQTTALEPTDTYASYKGELGVRHVVATIGPAGGEIIVDCTGGKPQDNLQVIFTVPPGALAEDTTVEMIVEGEMLSELTVDFNPGGVQFDPWAGLHYYLGIERVDLDVSQLQAVHIHDDGSSEIIDTEINHTGNARTVQIWLDVPGFSLYGLRD